MHAGVAEDGMLAAAKTRPKLSIGNRVSQKELTRAATVFVEILDGAIFHLETIERAGISTKGSGYIKQLGIIGGRIVIVRSREEDLDLVRGRPARLEIHIRCQEPGQLPGHGTRHTI